MIWWGGKREIIEQRIESKRVLSTNKAITESSQHSAAQREKAIGFWIPSSQGREGGGLRGEGVVVSSAAAVVTPTRPLACGKRGPSLPPMRVGCMCMQTSLCLKCWQSWPSRQTRRKKGREGHVEPRWGGKGQDASPLSAHKWKKVPHPITQSTWPSCRFSRQLRA